MMIIAMNSTTIVIYVQNTFGLDLGLYLVYVFKIFRVFGADSYACVSRKEFKMFKT